MELFTRWLWKFLQIIANVALYLCPLSSKPTTDISLSIFLTHWCHPYLFRRPPGASQRTTAGRSLYQAPQPCRGHRVTEHGSQSQNITTLFSYWVSQTHAIIFMLRTGQTTRHHPALKRQIKNSFRIGNMTAAQTLLRFSWAAWKHF